MKVISSTTYNRVHGWLKEVYGRAKRCENRKCDKTSTIYQWALKHGKQYEFVRENFKQLCSKCHSRYDKPYRQRRVTKVDEYSVRVSAETAKRLRIRAIHLGISLKELMDKLTAKL